MMLYVCCYGDEQGKEKGIVRISYDETTNEYQKHHLISLIGKTNMLVIHEDNLYVSEERKQQNYLIIYDKNGIKQKEIKTDYFYSYGAYQNEKLYLASFRDGIDSIYDCDKDKWIKHVIHKDENEKKGRSHFIHEWKQKIFLSVDNALQQVYFYDENLNIEKILSFPDINIRLLSFHPTLPYAYLNTEKTNEVIIIDLMDRIAITQVKMTNKKNSFSGGNAIDKDGHLLALSVRGENKIYLYEISDGKHLSYKSSFSCGAMPRDLYIHDTLLFVSCTMDNQLEVYDLITYKKKKSIPLQQPITFGIYN